MFTHKRILSECPFKSNKKSAQFFLFDSAVCSLTLQGDAHCGVDLRGVHYTFHKNSLGDIETEFKRI